MAGRPREVKTTPEFDRQRATIEANIKRFDELFQAIEWAFARSTIDGEVLGKFRLGYRGPRVQVKATVETNRVTLTDIKPLPEENGT